MNVHLNSSPLRGLPLGHFEQGMFGAGVPEELAGFMAPLGLSRTPLHRMEALASELRVGSLFVKDESGRSSLGSFKVLGGAYAVIRLVLAEAERQLGRAVAAVELQSSAVQAIARNITVTCATDGNHGRSVAFGARISGCRAVIFVHGHVSEGRVEAIEQLGARVIRIEGSYDDSVAEATRAADREGWHVVSDTSWPGYEETPARVMQGYLVMAGEVLQQLRALRTKPTHVFLQAGVGGFAAAMAAHFSLCLPDSVPRFIIVEPSRAACLFASAVAGAATRIAPGPPTVMAMLECYEPSFIAWRILERVADAYVTIEDEQALRTMRRLAAPVPPDPFILSGESGGAGLAAVLEAAEEERLRALLGLDEQSVVLVFNTEGATDRARYESLLRAG